MFKLKNKNNGVESAAFEFVIPHNGHKRALTVYFTESDLLSVKYRVQVFYQKDINSKEYIYCTRYA